MSKDEALKLTLGQKIRFMRELRGLKQENLAAELNLTTGGYGKIERDETDITISRLTQIAEVLKVTVRDILDIDEKKIEYSLHNSNASFHNSNFNNYTTDKEVYEKLIASLERENALLRETLEKIKLRQD